jgi:hypothetical protein
LLVGGTLAACVGDAAVPGAPAVDGGTDSTTAGPDAGTDVAADSSRNDGGTDAGACDRNKSFANPEVLMQGVQPLVAWHFRVAKGGTRAYFVAPSSTVVKGGDLAGAALSNVLDVKDTGASIVGGFGISEAETELLVAFQGTGVLQYTRANAGAAFQPADFKQFVFTAATPTAGDAVYLPYLSRSGGLIFALLQRPTVGPPITWDLLSGTLGGTVLAGALATGIKPPDGFASYPVLASPEHLFLARWGAGPTEVYPRLFESRRASATAPWGAPVPIAVGGLVPAGKDVLVPLDVTADECTLFFGRSDDVTSLYTVYRATRPK